ncbi:hypothetical protein [Streptomyces sp. NPDC049040]|uniref:hypothetical protein n=1 Tax=Streptomyces sp. NPDC049040 TaxID=3365593 RepID=UPI003718CCDA
MSVSGLRAAGPGAPPRPRERQGLAYLPLACGLLLLPWLVVLADSGTPQWVALDSLEAVGLVSTGLLALRGPHRALAPAAAGTATLLLLDASVDLATSHGAALLAAVAMAVLAELPLATACGSLALRGAMAQQPSSRLPR